MPLSVEDRSHLERLGADNVRQRLDHAGPGPGSVVPGLGGGFGVARSDVEAWLFEKDVQTGRLQLDILWWAKAATLISLIGVLVAIAAVAVPFIFRK